VVNIKGDRKLWLPLLKTLATPFVHTSV